ncbi:hypothetical protein LCGC14_0288580 [marine sediment metagenome]|uniref:Uncharacterized protein n=1 Tax=marine sediment metagenome TaxID=412755 RepID=A0A0F9WEV1_9ZZZZ
MNCLNCDGELVMRETFEYPLDSNGVWTREGYDIDQMGVYCHVCGAGHLYDEIHESGDQFTIALVANSDPKPVAVLAIGYRGGVVDAIDSESMVGLIAIDEDHREVGLFLTRPHDEASPWWRRAITLLALIKPGEWRANFAEGEEGDDSNKS